MSYYGSVEIFDWRQGKYRECEILDRNGNLVLIRYLDTDKEDWVSSQECVRVS